MPESGPGSGGGVKLSRTQERQSLQNLNNRLAGYIDKVGLKLISLCT